MAIFAANNFCYDGQKDKGNNKMREGENSERRKGWREKKESKREREIFS